MTSPPRPLGDELMRGFRWLLLVIALFAVGIVYMEWRFYDPLRYRAPQLEASPDAVVESHEIPFPSAHQQTVYVPAYSHVYHQNGQALLLTVTLSVRNMDRDNAISLTSVRYFDSSGNEVRSHLKKPLRLGPLATAEFLIERDDTSGGSGASFLVEWAAAQAVSDPIVETVMIDTGYRQGISFVRRGSVVSNTASDDEPK